MPRRLYLIWTNPLFRDSARALLSHPEIDWLGATSDYAAAGAAILQLHPDTVLVEELGNSLPHDLVEVLRLNRVDMRLIGASLDRNWLQVWQCEEHTLAQADDLLSLVLQ